MDSYGGFLSHGGTSLSLDGYGMLWKSMENPMDNIYGWSLGEYPYDLGKLRKLPTSLPISEGGVKKIVERENYSWVKPPDPDFQLKLTGSHDPFDDLPKDSKNAANS